MSDVEPGFSFAEALTAMGGIKDYTRLRREHGMEEDALLGYFYHELYRAVKDAADIDQEGFETACAVVQVPLDFGEEEVD